MLEIFTVGLDLAKTVFQAHGADASGWAVLRKKLRRDQVLAFYSQLQACIVAMKACGGSHYWVRKIAQLGHDVRRECHELCVWLPAHAGVSRGHAWKRSANMISNWLRAANHSRTFPPPFSKLRMARKIK